MVVAAPERRVRISRHASAEGTWELVYGMPAARLARYVRSYCGYHERTPGPAERRELPGPTVVLILELGPSLSILGPGGESFQHAGGFVAGLDDRFTLTKTCGEQRGIQIDLELRGAVHLFGMPMSELARRVVSLEDVFGQDVHGLRAQIEETPDWHARFTLLDRFLSERLRDDLAPNDWVDWAWRRLRESGGLVSIEGLAKEVGFSRKHLSVTFHERFGMTPKLLARLVRFDRAVRLLRSGRHRSFADVGLECGYFDQAHFIREFRDFAGSTPGEYLTPWPLAAEDAR